MSETNPLLVAFRAKVAEGLAARGVAEDSRSGDEQLMRFLRAREGNVDAAFLMWGKWFDWRREAAVDDLTYDDISEEFESGKAFWHGRDKAGRLCIVAMPRYHYPALAPPASFIRASIYRLEQGLRLFEGHPRDVFRSGSEHAALLAASGADLTKLPAEAAGGAAAIAAAHAQLAEDAALEMDAAIEASAASAQASEASPDAGGDSELAAALTLQSDAAAAAGPETGLSPASPPKTPASVASLLGEVRPDRQVCVIYDRLGMTGSNFDLGLMSAMRALTSIMQDSYAECMGTMYLVNPSTAFWVLYKAVSPLLSAKTKAKMRIIRSLPELQRYFDAEHLLALHGGTSPYRFPHKRPPAELKLNLPLIGPGSGPLGDCDIFAEELACDLYSYPSVYAGAGTVASVETEPALPPFPFPTDDTATGSAAAEEETTAERAARRTRSRLVAVYLRSTNGTAAVTATWVPCARAPAATDAEAAAAQAAADAAVADEDERCQRPLFAPSPWEARWAGTPELADPSFVGDAVSVSAKEPAPLFAGDLAAGTTRRVLIRVSGPGSVRVEVNNSSSWVRSKTVRFFTRVAPAGL